MATTATPETFTGELPEADLLLRKSKIVREGERALSIRAQEERGRQWAAEHGYKVRKVWKENLSAWSDVKRPKMDAAMSAVLNGEVPALWCYAMDRFSRKGAEAVVPILGKARIIFDYERLDSLDERDRRWIIDRAENAREYSQRLSYNVRTTKQRQLNEGRWLAQAPFGLIADAQRKLMPNTEPYIGVIADRKVWSPWQIVLRIFDAVGNKGISVRALARALNAEGIPTAKGKGWRVQTIRQIILHPVYEGWMTIVPNLRVSDPDTPTSNRAVPYLNPNGERVYCVTPDVLPRMITAELAERARRVMQGHQIPTLVNKPRAGRQFYPLSGKLRCAGCKYAMVMDGRSYNCSQRSQGGACPNRASVMRGALENYVVAAWSARLHAADPTDPLLAIVAERWSALSRSGSMAEVNDAKAAVKAAQVALDKFHADDREGFYSGRSARYRIPAKNEAEARLDAAEERLAELSGGTIDIAFLLEGKAAEVWQNADPTMRRDLLDLAIETVTVSKGRQGKPFIGAERVQITWVSPVAAEQAEDILDAALAA